MILNGKHLFRKLYKNVVTITLLMSICLVQNLQYVMAANEVSIQTDYILNTHDGFNLQEGWAIGWPSVNYKESSKVNNGNPEYTDSNGVSTYTGSNVKYNPNTFKFLEQKNNSDTHLSNLATAYEEQVKKALSDKGKEVDNLTEEDVDYLIEQTSKSKCPGVGIALFGAAYYVMTNNSSYDIAKFNYSTTGGSNGSWTGVTVYGPNYPMPDSAVSEYTNNAIYLSDPNFESDPDFLAICSGTTLFEQNGGVVDTITGKVEEAVLGTIEDALEGIMNWITTQISNLFSDVLNYMMVDITEIFHADPTDFVNLFQGNGDLLSVFRYIGYSLLVIIFILTLFISLFPVGVNSESVFQIVIRTLVAGFLLFNSWTICRILFSIAGAVENTIQVYGNANFDTASVSTMLKNLDILTIVKLFFLLYFTWEVFKLFLEIIERWVLVNFMYCVSPMAGATFCSSYTSNITGSFYRSFITNLVIMVFNIWVLCLLQVFIANSNTILSMDKWSSLTYLFVLVAFVRLAQRMDDYVNYMGLSAPRIGANWGNEVFQSSMNMVRVGALAVAGAGTGVAIGKAGYNKLNDIADGTRFGGTNNTPKTSLLNPDKATPGVAIAAKSIAGDSKSKSIMAMRSEGNRNGGTVIGEGNALTFGEFNREIGGNVLSRGQNTVDMAINSGIVLPEGSKFVPDDCSFQNGHGILKMTNADGTPSEMSFSVGKPMPNGTLLPKKDENSEDIFARMSSGAPLGGYSLPQDQAMPLEAAQKLTGNLTPEQMEKAQFTQEQMANMEVESIGEHAMSLHNADDKTELYGVATFDKNALGGIEADSGLSQMRVLKPVNDYLTMDELLSDPMVSTKMGSSVAGMEDQLVRGSVDGDLKETGQVRFETKDGKRWEIKDAARNIGTLSSYERRNPIPINRNNSTAHIILKEITGRRK